MSTLGNTTYKTFNPELNQENDTLFIEANTIEIEEAITLASKTFDIYKNISGIKKSEFLNAIADEIVALDEVLIKIYCSESGLPIQRAYVERERTIFQLRSFANLVKNGSWVQASIDTSEPDRKPVAKPDIRKINIPIGPVVVFGASNFPLAYSTAGGDTASALAAGCPVIVKSHPMHAGTGELVASAIIKAANKTGMPNGVFSNLNSSDISVGQKLVMHPKIKAVGFTGSIKGGRALLDLASKREEPIPVFAEMGSVNPVVILPKALKNNTDAWAAKYAKSITLSTGQFCTNPGLMLSVKSKSLDRFIQLLSNNITQINPSCMLHPNIAKSYDENKHTACNQKGVNTVAQLTTKPKANYASQTITTVNGNDFLNNPTLHQEVFGPYSIIVQCESLEQLELIINKLEGQLTGTIISDENEAEDYPSLISALQNKVGRMIFNGVSTGVEVCSSMVHGGPYPASTDSRFTAVGINSIKRWVRPFSFQNWPNNLLPEELKNENTLQILRSVNGKLTKNKLKH